MPNVSMMPTPIRKAPPAGLPTPAAYRLVAELPAAPYKSPVALEVDVVQVRGSRRSSSDSAEGSEVGCGHRAGRRERRRNHGCHADRKRVRLMLMSGFLKTSLLKVVSPQGRRGLSSR